MKQRFFITGTDTDAGKTFVSCALLKTAQQRGYTAIGLKPVAAGAQQIDGQLRNDDALALQSASSKHLPYEQVNPIVLAAAIAPHIAAEQVNKRLSVQAITGFIRGTLMTQSANLTLVEGAGGWRVPLNSRETFADIAKSLELEVILVVGMRLGCINHALLTAEAIRRDGLKLVGWVANCIDPDMPVRQENIATLQNWLPAPLLGVMPYVDDSQSIPSDWLSEQFLPSLLQG